MKSRIFYLTEFPSTYLNRTWWGEKDRKHAVRFVKYIKDAYDVQGKVIKVKECK